MRQTFRGVVAGVGMVMASVAAVGAQSPLDGFQVTVDKPVWGTLRDPDGRLLVFGDFTDINGSGRAAIARLIPSGGIDTTFANPVVIGSVHTAVRQPDGKLVVGGAFSSIGGAAKTNLARINADGSLDASFTAVTNGTVFALALQADGKILVGGVFTTLSAQTRNNVGRLNENGTLDSSFNPGTNGIVAAIVALSDGRICIAGGFSTVGGGGTGATARRAIAQLDSLGNVDASFDPGTNGTIWTMATQADGKIVVGGEFTMLGGGGFPGTTPRNLIGRLNANGALDTLFEPVLPAAIATATDMTIFSVAVQDDGRVVAAGGFNRNFGGFAFRLQPTGSLDDSFNRVFDDFAIHASVQSDGKILIAGGGSSASVDQGYLARFERGGTAESQFSIAANGDVLAVAVQSDGGVIVGGNFTTLSEPTLPTLTRQRIGRITPTGGADGTFNPGVNGTVHAIAIQPDGKVLVGGSFSTIGGGGTGLTTRHDLARLHADGSLDTGFDVGTNGFVYGLTVQADGKILVGGLFSMIGGGGTGTTARNNIVRLNPDGSIDAAFDVGVGANEAVHSFVEEPSGQIIVVGNFTELRGQPRRYIGRLNTNGTLDSYNPGANSFILSAARQADGKLVVGGQFSMIGGGGFGSTARTRLARLASDGTVDASFNPGANGNVRSIALLADGRILVGGEFTMLGGGGSGVTARERIGRLNADGTHDSTFGSSANGTVSGIAVLPDGKAFVTGAFTLINGQVRQRMARLTMTHGVAQALTTTTSSVQWLRGGGAAEFARVTFESSTDGVTYTSLGPAVPSPGVWQLTGLTLPMNQRLFIRARASHAGGYLNGSNSAHESVHLSFNQSCTAVTSLTPGSLASGFVGVPYSAAQLSIVNGTGPSSFGQESSTTLPPGMSLSSTTGIISGTPTQSGSFDIAVIAADSIGCYATGLYQLVINNCPVIDMTPTTLPVGVMNGAYSAVQLTRTGGVGTGTMLVSSGALPAGVTLSSDGVLTGTPTVNGTFTFTVTASDANGCNGSREYSLTVAGTVPVITVQPQAVSVAPGQAASFTAVASGDPAPTYQWQTSMDGGTTWLDLTETTPYADVTTATLRIMGTLLGMNGQRYRLVATNTGGSAASNGALLTVAKPQMTLDRTSMIFTAVNSGSAFTARSGAQTVRLSQQGAGTVSWTATPTVPWLTVTPTSGSGSATLRVSVQFAAGLAASQGGAITFAFAEAATTSASVTVTLNTVTPGNSTVPVGLVDTPLDGAAGVAGSIGVTGWAVDDLQVERVTICRDTVPGEVVPTTAQCNNLGQVYIGDAVFVEGARPDIAAAYSNLPFNTRAGWGYLMLTNFLPARGNGTFTLHAFASDADGHTTLLGTRTITCTNSASLDPFGAIDTPGQGETTSGANYANFGWVLSPGTRRADGPGGGSVKVLIDGVDVGSPVGWSGRADLSFLFPAAEYSGINSALAVFTMNTTALSNGVHTIAWVVTANDGRAAGVGSRFFTVSNGALALAPQSTRPQRAFSSVITADDPPPHELDEAIERVALSTHPLPIRRGFDLEAAFERMTPADRQILVQSQELDRIEVLLPVADGVRYTGYLRTGNGLAPLPIGSRLEHNTGAFTWMPGVAFIGNYDLVFVRWNGASAVERHEIRIVLNPKGSGLESAGGR